LNVPEPNVPEAITFIQGLKTIGGHGDPTLKEGLAVHQYAFNADMDRQAFVNNDGDMLLVPQRGILDIQTELGYLRIRPGEIAVLPAGIRFSVRIVPPRPLLGFDSTVADSSAEDLGAAGYALEIFGTHFKLPELGPIGGNGLAHVRDFEHPVASFDLDPPVATAQPTNATPSGINIPHNRHTWKTVIKLGGKLWAHTQPHTPFDVVAWHGCYSPYKYVLSRFINLSVCNDQLDPTAFTVLTAPSKWPGVSLVDFCVFGEKWLATQNTLRIPYHHRTMATELGGVIKGTYRGSVRPLQPGGMSFEQAYMPHGETYEAWQREREGTQEPIKVCEGYLGMS
jgi:homogentisate 1,2-dioxygenase